MLFITRHGQTDMNKQGLVCGVTDIPLNAHGIEQAQKAAEEFSRTGGRLDVIYTSPLQRAQQTAVIFAGQTGAKRLTDPRLTEQDYGCFEATDHTDERFIDGKRNLACRFGGGESIFRVVQRAYNFLDEILPLSREQNILVVSHGGVCRVMHTYFEDLRAEDYPHFFFGNCEVRCYCCRI
ncbi:MAG: histidine phosphatase family protein [Oscillospiraceae bacterium]